MPTIMTTEETLRELQEILEDRMEIDRKATSELDDTELEDIMDAECVECGRMYYSDYLMPNFQNQDELGTPVDELCIDCYLERSH
jgi:hypothetical protein